jgi:cytochrome P450
LDKNLENFSGYFCCLDQALISLIFPITGKRDCLGKSLALTELYLFFSALMQKYSFHWIDEDHLEQLVTKPKIGFIQSPPPYQVIVKKRN